jgi:hypothetical protein
MLKRPDIISLSMPAKNTAQKPIDIFISCTRPFPWCCRY